ncbi:peptidoglycan DD-metalloendopeptidase family protein [Brevibacillus fluminis]|uniref:peptidoglycan DD-metalloendopeptidase family protein n=1 Tax=Brevibacillus fluminis TaxID=511487 RepID=UPI003F89EB87
MEDQKNPNQPIPLKKSKSWKTFLGKKWAFPAIYIGLAAIILAFVMWYQGNVFHAVSDELSKQPTPVAQNQPETTAPNTEVSQDDAVPVSKATQPLAWPVAASVSYSKAMDFFNDAAAKEEQAKALVKYNNSYIPHTGIDIVSTDKKGFDVAAALDGKVKKVENDPLVGNLVEIEHSGNMVTVYQSLDKVTVKPGDEVKQGQVLGAAGRSTFEKDAGIHLHFEVRVDGKSVNPEQYLNHTEQQ